MKRKKAGFLLLGCVTVAFSLIIASSFFIYNLGIKRQTEQIVDDRLVYSGTYLMEKSIQTMSVTAVSSERPDKKTPLENEGLSVQVVTDTGRWLENQYYEKWSLTSHDGLQLMAYYLPASQETDKTAIIAHGYYGKGLDMDSYARFYAEKLGFNVLLPDARGHGASQGNYIGFGWPDREDYLQWIEKVIERSGREAQIVLHGISMGGSTVMMVSGETLPEQVKAIIEDCGYTSVADEFTYQLESRIGAPAFPFIPAASLLAQIRAGYNFYEASAVKQVAKAKTPMLFIHGTEDTFVPTEMVWQLYQACPAPKEIYLAYGAGHGMAYGVDPSFYENVVTRFLSRFVTFDYPAL